MDAKAVWETNGARNSDDVDSNHNNSEAVEPGPTHIAS